MMPRTVTVPVAHELFQEMMTEGWESCLRCIEGLPSGAELVGAHCVDPFRVGGTVYLVYRHENFEDLPIGTVAPMVSPTFERIEIDKGGQNDSDPP